MEAVIFIGVQASGKSSFYRETFFNTHLRINLDMLRTRHREEIFLKACIHSSQPFVVDNTNPLPADRLRYLVPAREAGFRLIAYFFDSTLQGAIERNGLRPPKQRVPAPAIAATFKKIQPPSSEEGFDDIFTVQIKPDGKFAVSEGIRKSVAPL